jgi:hypothetical protein
VPQAPSKEAIRTLDTLIQSLPSAVALPKTLEGSKNNNFAKTDKDPKFPQNLRPNSLLSTTGKLFEKK